MKNMRTLASAGLALWLTGAAHALPAVVEADRLQLHAKAAMDSGDFATAAADFAQIEKLGVKKLPQSLPYHYGVALLGVKKYADAKTRLEAYLALGTNTKFYREALERYNEADKALENERAERARKEQKEREEQARKEKKYQDDLARYEDAKRNHGPKIERCMQDLHSDYQRQIRELEDAQQAAEKCSSGWGNAINMASGGQDRCERLWKRYEQKREPFLSGSASRYEYEYDRRNACQRRTPEPTPPSRS